ncbi:uncharacterized protein [Misgurnus anguillicaudatus]|uniref:uncharacterized protein n=1 Tax=Misgurnus anguillicaudatus TaxID=75329 RepID=UPI003CCF606D
MDLHVFIFVSAILTISEGFTVKGSSGPLVVPLGGSVVLPCSVDSLLPLEDLEVEWRRSDSQTLIHLYQDEDIRPESQHQDYHDRAHFFTEDIKHGNFSLLLNNLTAEDEGQYTCKVYTGQESEETVVEIKHVERLIVSGSSPSISASVGDDVTLNCSVNSHIKPEEIEEVSWKKTDKGEPITVLLYQNNETLSGSSDERYRDRVEFFTDEIHRGNFSLRLKRVTTEDKGVYICQVFNGELSANTTVILERLGFSVLHIMVLILCITACGSALLFCSLIYSRSNNTEKDDRKQQQKHRVPEIHWRNPEDRELCELQKNLWSLNETRQVFNAAIPVDAKSFKPETGHVTPVKPVPVFAKPDHVIAAMLQSTHVMPAISQPRWPPPRHVWRHSQDGRLPAMSGTKAKMATSMSKSVPKMGNPLSIFGGVVPRRMDEAEYTEDVAKVSKPPLPHDPGLSLPYNPGLIGFLDCPFVLFA